MIRRVVNFFALLLIAALLWGANYKYPEFYYFWKGFETFLTVALIYFFFKILLESIALKSITDSKTGYSIKKAFSIIFYLLILLAVIGIWIENAQTLILFYGIIGAGVAVTLQDILKNFAGSVILFATGIYRVGDRIEVNSRYGDVIDIGILYTTLMEIKEWVAGDQPSGRLTVIPNSYVISMAVNNYTKDHSFIYDEIMVPITYDSDWRKASEIMLGIVRKETEDITEIARKEIDKIGEKYYLQRKVVDPAIYMTLTDNWIRFSIRYVTSVRERRILHNKLNKMILEAIQRHDDIRIASTTVDIVGFPEVKFTRDGNL
ncbi:mechanosensitive ion channel family protein [Methanooceanicella nereidis]|uniref:mechanosensitive ion channel family protein n=1 Tax=Methanooceanicella nereidis TaxID=2052831 RepID=UPI001E3484FB